VVVNQKALRATPADKRSRGEVIPGLSAVAAPILRRDGSLVASVAVVFAGKADEPVLAERVMDTARQIAAELP
jgi:DNA-binding IclR family transcriptional regulator